MLNPFIHWIEAKGPYAPWLFLALFVVASFVMIWRLEVLSANGFEGTVLGTLVMPYCTGMGNLIFTFIIGHTGGNGADVMTNSLVNNVTNMTLVLGLPAIFWRMSILPRQKKNGKTGSKAHELNRLSLLFTLMAVLFFTGAVWPRSCWPSSAPRANSRACFGCWCPSVLCGPTPTRAISWHRRCSCSTRSGPGGMGLRPMRVAR